VKSKEVGTRGEDFAVRYLTARGYRIHSRNFRCRLGEIDIVAEEQGKLVFVEVKTRHGDRYGLPQEAVTPAKQERLRRLAQYYLSVKRITDRPCRFDVLALTIGGDEIKPVLIRGAF
jgi:putative endonuclease